jgi:magnesium transporter
LLQLQFPREVMRANSGSTVDATLSIESTVYVQGRGSVSASFAEARQASRETGSMAWFSLVELGERDLGAIAGSLGLEPRLLEEAARFPHRSAVERHETWLVAVLPILRGSGEGDGTAGNGGFRPEVYDWVLALAVEEPNTIVTLTDGERVAMDRVHQRVEGRLDLLAHDSGAVLLEIVGEVVGDYERAVEAIDRHIWDAEVTVMEGRSRNVLRRIHALTSQAVGLQQATKPLASTLEQVTGSDDPVAHRQLSRIRHRALRVTEKLDGARELLSSLLQVNLTVVGQKISAWGAILIVPSLIAGVFGMNFDSAWLTQADHGFEVMLGVMFLISASLYLWFKRSGWL